MSKAKEIAEENKKMRKLRALVDFAAAVLSQGHLAPGEALALVAATKKSVLALFPDKEETFDLIYKPRFDRIIKERLQSN
ncbi:MAG: hypothetical protein ACE5HO_09710 [bacterium]